MSLKKGFTLLELLLVITVILILLGLAVLAITKALESARAAERKSALSNVESAISAFHQYYGYYPGLKDGPVGIYTGQRAVRFADGGSQWRWYYPQSSFDDGTKVADAWHTPGTVNSKDLFFALEGLGNDDQRQFIDASLVYVLVNGKVMTLQKARNGGNTTPLPVGMIDAHAKDGIAWFGVAIRLDVNACFVTLPKRMLKSGGDSSKDEDWEWYYNGNYYDDLTFQERVTLDKKTSGK